MSIRVVDWVLRESPATQGRRLVLIALADTADDDGGDTYPSVETVASKARLSVRATKYALKQLRESGAIVDCGPSKYGTRTYRIVMEGADFAPPGGAERDVEGVQSTTPGGAKSDTIPGADCTQTVLKPSKEPSKETGESLEDLFAYWLGKTGRNGGTRLTPKRRAKLKARLAEPPTIGPTRADDIRAAIDFVAGSDWHVERGHTDLTLICRSPEQIDGYLQRAKTKPAQDKLSQYDQAIRN